jgi:hypothetical protein
MNIAVGMEAVHISETSVYFNEGTCVYFLFHTQSVIVSLRSAGT